MMGGTRRYRNREHFSAERGSFPHNPRTLDKPTDGKVAWMQPDLKDSLQIHKNSAAGEHTTNSDELVKKYTMVQIYRYRFFLPFTIKAAVVSCSPHTQVYSPASFSSTSWTSSFMTVPSCLILYLSLALSKVLPFLHSA